MMPEIVKFLKYFPILMVLGGIGYGAYYAMQNYKDPYKCFNNHLFKQKSIDSNVYVYIGDVCISGNDNDTEEIPESR